MCRDSHQHAAQAEVFSPDQGLCAGQPLRCGQQPSMEGVDRMGCSCCNHQHCCMSYRRVFKQLTDPCVLQSSMHCCAISACNFPGRFTGASGTETAFSVTHMETLRGPSPRGSFWGVSSGSVSWASSRTRLASTSWMGSASCNKQRSIERSTISFLPDELYSGKTTGKHQQLYIQGWRGIYPVTHGADVPSVAPGEGDVECLRPAHMHQ